MSREGKLLSHHQAYTTSLAADVLPLSKYECTTRLVRRSRRNSCHQVVEHLEFGRREFNRQRKLFIQNVPPVTHQDVKEYMGHIVPADIVISKRLQHVIIALKCSDDIDLALRSLKGRLLANCPVQLELYPRRMMLYICGIPIHYTDESYRVFLSAYGEVETAFLSLTSDGNSRGYGFVEFAHNRATLERVQEAINGSTLEGSTLYCGLVPDSIRTYEQTFSTTLFCVCKEQSLIARSWLAKTLQPATTFKLAEGLTVHVLECTDVQSADRLWYYSHTTADTTAIYLQYSVPGLSAHQLCAVVEGAQREEACVDVDRETREVIHGLFPSQPQLVLSLEKLVSQLRSTTGDQPLNISTILNLAKFLRSTKDKQSMTSLPPQVPRSVKAGVLEPSLSYNQNGVVPSNTDTNYKGPVTRSRYLSSSNQTTAQVTPANSRGSEPSGGWCEWPTQVADRPIQDVKCRTRSGAVEPTVARSVSRRGDRKSPGQAGRKRRNSGRSADNRCENVAHGWSIWDGLGTACPWVSHPPTAVSITGAYSVKEKENMSISRSSTAVCDSTSEPLAKKPFRRTPGAEKRERRLCRTSGSTGNVLLFGDSDSGDVVGTTPNAMSKRRSSTRAEPLPIGQHCQGLSGCYVDLLLAGNTVSHQLH